MTDEIIHYQPVIGFDLRFNLDSSRLSVYSQTFKLTADVDVGEGRQWLEESQNLQVFCLYLGDGGGATVRPHSHFVLLTPLHYF